MKCLGRLCLVRKQTRCHQYFANVTSCSTSYLCVPQLQPFFTFIKLLRSCLIIFLLICKNFYQNSLQVDTFFQCTAIKIVMNVTKKNLTKETRLLATTRPKRRGAVPLLDPIHQIGLSTSKVRPLSSLFSIPRSLFVCAPFLLA